MTTITDLILEYRTQIRDVVPTVWAPSTDYVSGQRVISANNVYLSIVGGTSGTTGPSGTTNGQTDGSVVWNYLSEPYAPALSDQEIMQFINDGFRTYSKYRPRKRSTTIQVVKGQSAYTLPSDWIERDYDSWERAIDPPPVADPDTMMPFTFISTAELIARPMAYVMDVAYDFYPSDLQMVITPSPQASYELQFDYYAYHTADSTSCSVPFVDMDNALLSGLVKGIRAIATDYSTKLQLYKAGNNIQIDDRTVAVNLQNRANELNKQFERDIIKRPQGSMG